LAEGKELVAGKAAAYLCVEQSCWEPVTTPKELGGLLDEMGQGGNTAQKGTDHV
jgi:hypothetical protein